MNPAREQTPDADIDGRIRAVLVQHGRLVTDALQIAVDDDLYRAGMSSHASVNVMLALESSFGIEFPDELLKRSVFASIGSIRDAIRSI